MVQGMTWRTQLSSWNQRPFWGHTSEHKARISSKTGPKHVWCLCIKAVPVRWNLPFLEDSHPTWPFPPLLLCNSSSINPCAQLPLRAVLSALTKCQLRHKFLIHTWALLSDNPPGLLHPPTLLSPPEMGASAEIPLVMKALTSTPWHGKESGEGAKV